MTAGTRTARAAVTVHLPLSIHTVPEGPGWLESKPVSTANPWAGPGEDEGPPLLGMFSTRQRPRFGLQRKLGVCREQK